MIKKARRKKKWGIDLDFDCSVEIADTWAEHGFDVEEFFVPDVDANAFDFEDEDDDPDENHECRYVRPKMKPVKRSSVRYEKAEAFADALGMIDFGERIDALISGKFIMGDFIEAFMVKHNVHTKRMIISTLSYSENNVDSIRNLLDGGFVDTVDIIVSPYFYAHERNALIRYTYEQLDDENNRLQLAVCPVHTKTYQFVTDGGRHIIMHGSANLRANSNFENMVIEENEDVYNFYADFYDEILKEYPTIQKDKKYLKTWFRPEMDDLKEGEH